MAFFLCREGPAFFSLSLASAGRRSQVRYALTTAHQRSRPEERPNPPRLCRSLCRNPAIPARVGPSQMVSLDDRWKTMNMRDIRINTHARYHLVSSSVLPSDFAR